MVDGYERKVGWKEGKIQRGEREDKKEVKKKLQGIEERKERQLQDGCFIEILTVKHKSGHTV